MRWKVTLYLDDKCREHATPEECNTPPDWYEGEPEDWKYEGYCWRSVPEGELDTEAEAKSWMDVLLKYGDKHQEASFIDRSIEQVTE